MIRLNRSIAALLVTCLVWPMCAQASSGNPPTELVVRVGGYLGPTHVIELKRHGLWCTELQHGQPINVHLASPTREQWNEFRSQLNTMNLERWQKAYLNPDVLDGTQWHVHIRYPDLAVESAGSNNFPDVNGKPNGSPEESAAFHRFRASFSILDKKCRL